MRNGDSEMIQERGRWMKINVTGSINKDDGKGKEENKYGKRKKDAKWKDGKEMMIIK